MVETMKVYGINKETGVQEYIGEAPITYEMKINDIAQSYFGGCDPDDRCMCEFAMHDFYNWLKKNGYVVDKPLDLVHNEVSI